MSADAIKKLFLDWLLSKPLMGAFNLSSNGYHWEFYDTALINELGCKSRTKKTVYPVNREEVLKSYQGIDLYANQATWKTVGFEMEELTQITHSLELFYFIYRQLDEEGKCEILSLGERFLPFRRMLEILKSDKEVFSRYMTVMPKSFAGLLEMPQIAQLLDTLRHHYTDKTYTYLLYSFLSNHKKQLARIEVQSIASHAVKLYVEDKSRFEAFFPDIVGEDYFLPISSVVCLKISKSVFYNLLAGSKPFEQACVTNYLLSFILYLDKKEKKRLCLNHAYLLNHDNAAKHYIIVLDTAQGIFNDYQDMIETVLKMCRGSIGVFENKQEHFKKALDYYFLEKYLPPKGDTDKVSKI